MAIQRVTRLQIGAASASAMLLLCGGGVFSLVIIPILLLWVAVTQWGLRTDRPRSVFIVQVVNWITMLPAVLLVGVGIYQTTIVPTQVVEWPELSRLVGIIMTGIAVLLVAVIGYILWVLRGLSK